MQPFVEAGVRFAAPMIVGGLVWFLAKHGKVAEMGRILFACSLMAAMAQVAL